MADFSTSELLEVQLKVDEMWADAQVNKFYKAEVEGLRAIQENSAATFEALTTDTKNNKVSVHWITTSNLAVTEGVVDNCNIDGPTVDSAKRDYALDMFPKIDFSVTEQRFKTSIFSREEVVAKEMLEAMRQMDENLAMRAMAKADGYAGTNAYVSGAVTQAGGKTVIPSAYGAPETMAYLQQAMIINRMRNSFLIENGTSYQAQLVAAFNAGNLDGKGNVAAWQAIDIYNDLFNMTAAGLTTDALLISRNALAFVHKSRFNDVPEVIGGRVNQTHYSVPSPSLVGVRYDVIYELECAPGAIVNDVDAKHTWRVMANAGLFNNPTRTAGNTGVIAIDRA